MPLSASCKYVLWSAVISHLMIGVHSLSVFGQETVVASGLSFDGLPEKISFNEHVRPILSNHCWNCHGRADNSRQAGLRLDMRESALKPAESGQTAIVPGKPHESELIARILSHDESVVMPPPETKRPLTDQQKEILRRWISEGAEYAEHWAFIPPKRTAPPEVRDTNWPAGPIDQFILHRIEQEGLQPSSPAPPLVWLRRVTLDLTGFPPSVPEQHEFEQDVRQMGLAEAKRIVADRLLASPRYAERMAMHWLDVARYADTNGYNNDETRTMWPWRDWVINAFAVGMPYDQFVREQLAGDLLPEPSISQKVATGFNRNHVLTTEGGIIEEEYHVEYVADRIHTTSTVFLALSMQCARCHDHKYDPLSQRDYYQMAAFFNNVPDRIVSYSLGRMAEPLLKVPTKAQQEELRQIEERLAAAQLQMDQRRTTVNADVVAWEASLTPEAIQNSGPPGICHHFMLDEPEGNVTDVVVSDNVGVPHGNSESVTGRFGRARKFDGQAFFAAGQTGAFDSHESFTLSVWIRPEGNSGGTVLSKMDDENAYRGYDIILDNGRVNSHFVHHWPDRAFKVTTEQPVSPNEWHHLAVVYDGSRRASGLHIYVDGKDQKLNVTTDNTLDGPLTTDKPFHIGRRQTGVPFHGLIDDIQLYRTALSAEDAARLAAGETSGSLKDLLATPREQRTEQQVAQITEYYLQYADPVSRDLRKELAELPRRRDEIENEIPVTMIMQEQPERRPAFILNRGQYDQRGEEVTAAIPAVFKTAVSVSDSAGPAAANPTRLDFANWLTSPEHPLTARVAVNRWWEMLFGTGIVETSEDFGVQGALPSHPELLDWLATELVAQKWDQREILKQIVLSSTYGQSSLMTHEQFEKDPKNKWLARGARFRIPAESVRDSALFVSGLYREKIGGPSVRPYQPEGLWEDVSVERREKYIPDSGDGLYRRSMYTFWKRTCPPPTMSTFDAPDRETCVVRRARTNTPLQALVLMNDPTYVEAARKLAERLLVEETDNQSRWSLLYQIVLTRKPADDEVVVLNDLLKTATDRFSLHPDQATELLKVGQSPVHSDLNPQELAAWSSVCSVVLNLDEAITRP